MAYENRQSWDDLFCLKLHLRVADRCNLWAFGTKSEGGDGCGIAIF